MSEKLSDDWYCPTCNDCVSGESVTFEEVHVICGTFIGEIWQKTKAALETRLSKMEEALRTVDEWMSAPASAPWPNETDAYEARQISKRVREALAGSEDEQ